MRKIFIDIGGWNGASAIFFRKYHPESSEFEIFTFECDRKNINTIQKLNLPITLIPKAAWSSTGNVKFYYSGIHTNAGGTLYPKKITGGINPNNFYNIEVIDIAKFMIENFSIDDYIIMKINAEGSEYKIIEHLQKNNMIDWINKWFVQWHYHKIRMPRKEHDRIASMIPKSYPWDCQCNEVIFKDKFIESLKD